MTSTFMTRHFFAKPLALFAAALALAGGVHGAPSSIPDRPEKLVFPPLNWQPLGTYTNVAATNGVIRILDTNIPAAESQRFYRARFGP